MFVNYIGEFAALGTSVAYAFGATLFTLSGKTLGTPLMNRARLLIALFAVILVHFLWSGNFLPAGAGLQPWFWLGISGLIGFAIGDGLLFQAFIMIGPRLSMLIFSTAPVLGALLAWIFLGETLDLMDILGIAVTMSGIALVVMERTEKSDTDKIPDNPRYFIYGLLFALGGAAGQATGQVLAKVGLANDFPTFSALLIRLIVSTAFIWVLATMRGEVKSSYHKLKASPRAVGMLTVAAILGPVIGVWLSLVSIQHSSIGVATTLGSLTPVVIIPVAYFALGDKITWQAVIGTLVAMAGSALLFI